MSCIKYTRSFHFTNASRVHKPKRREPLPGVASARVCFMCSEAAVRCLSVTVHGLERSGRKGRDLNCTVPTRCVQHIQHILLYQYNLYKLCACVSLANDAVVVGVGNDAASRSAARENQTSSLEYSQQPQQRLSSPSPLLPLWVCWADCALLCCRRR